MFIAALILAAVGVAFFLASQGQAAKARDIGLVKASTVAELSDMAAKIAAEIGPGSYVEYTEIKGRSAAENPLKAEYSGTECVWYECVATREYEEEYWEESQGRRERKTRRGSEQVSRIVRDPPFLVDDGSGKLEIHPQAAVIEPEKSYSQFEPGTSDGTLRIGLFNFNLGSLPGKLGGGRRTIGYKFEERCIPVNRELYLIGEVTDSGSSLVMQKPAEKSKRFIISLKSKEALLTSAKRGSKGFRVASVVAIIAAAVLTVLGIF